MIKKKFETLKHIIKIIYLKALFHLFNETINTRPWKCPRVSPTSSSSAVVHLPLQKFFFPRSVSLSFSSEINNRPFVAVNLNNVEFLFFSRRSLTGRRPLFFFPWDSFERQAIGILLSLSLTLSFLLRGCATIYMSAERQRSTNKWHPCAPLGGGFDLKVTKRLPQCWNEWSPPDWSSDPGIGPWRRNQPRRGYGW